MTLQSPQPLSLQALIDNPNNDSLSQQLLPVIQSATHPSVIANAEFGQLRLDSRHVASQDVFVLLKSQTEHPDNCQKSADYLIQAAKQAVFILSEIDPVAVLDNAQLSQHTLSCPVLYVPHIRDFLGSLVQACLQYQQPNPVPTVVAVTGTNGKTTISQLIAQLTQLAGMSSAVMGTAGNGKLGALMQASHTTGDALAVQQFLYQMATEGADILALEASSHGLDQQRLQGVPVKVAIYSNLSRDHLDYHADMDEYVAAKAKLFDKRHFPSLTHAIINSDDEYASMMLETAQASGLTVWTYSLHADSDATFVATSIHPSLEGVKVALQCQIHKQVDKQADNKQVPIKQTDIKKTNEIDIISPLLGRFNVANLLAAIAAAVALGLDIEQLTRLIPSLQGAGGRMQRVDSNEGCFIVDYAHTPDALTQVLASLKTHCRGQLWAVFGCGGDRDAGKRPLMAQAGLAGAHQVVLTADNPRSEDPNNILKDMQAGMNSEQYQRTHIEPARQKAIAYAVRQASADDIVVIAGKGHETYQEINGVRYDFDDRLILQHALQQAGRL